MWLLLGWNKKNEGNFDLLIKLSNYILFALTFGL